MKRGLPVLVLFTFVSGATGARAQESGGRPAPQAELPAVLEALGPGSPPPGLEYVRRHFAPGADSGWAQARLTSLAILRERTGGLEEVTVTSRGAARWTLRAREHRTGWWVPVTIGVDSTAPHRVTSISAGPARPRSGISPRLLTEPELLGEITALIRAYCEHDVFSGVLAIARGSTIVYQEACGESVKGSGAGNTVATRFNVASASKMFTAIAIAQLVERGAIALSDSVARFLPDVPTPEAAARIRVEHLLTHTSGLPDMYPDEWERSSRTRFRTLDDYVVLVRGQPLAFEPGTRTAYSNTGFLLLGKIIEVVTGQSFFDFVSENVLDPAGMTGTCYCEMDRVNADLALGYAKEYGEGTISFRNNLYSEPIKGSPAGGAFATAEDLVRFAHALESERLVSRELMQTFTTPKPHVHADLSAYGYGFITRRGGRSFGHNGGTTGVAAEVETFRDRGYTMVVLSNYSGVGAEVAARIRTLMVQGLPEQ